jgi:epoxyqueuosine reductase
MELTKKIKDKALDLGFDLVGIASAKPFYQAKKILEERKINNKLPDFTTDDIDLRTIPHLHQNEVKTIIALAMSYASSNTKSSNAGKIALYARGEDYHRVIMEKTKNLILYIKKIKLNAVLNAYTDTTPLLEREIAQRAGLGWIGKNNNIINEKYGSYLLLGEILTNLDLDIDKELKNKCGNCNECIRACPVNALEKAYFLNPDKCAGNLTQRKDILTEKEREFINDNIWGCDSCLDVCPYNRNIPGDLHPEFYPVIDWDLKEILEFDKETFNNKWSNKALAWRGLRTLKRNSIIVIANKRLIKYLPDLFKILNNPSPILRIYTVWALGKIGIDECRDKLLKLYIKEKDIRVREEIIKVFNNNCWGELYD